MHRLLRVSQVSPVPENLSLAAAPDAGLFHTSFTLLSAGPEAWKRQREAWRSSHSSRHPGGTSTEAAEHEPPAAAAASPPRRRPRVLDPSLSYYEVLSNFKPFEKPIPLPEMVDFLVEVWEREGVF